MKLQTNNIPKAQPAKITFVRSYEAHSVLKSFVLPEYAAKWTYTAFPEKVYVRGSKGYISWAKTAPRDLRPVIILELD